MRNETSRLLATLHDLDLDMVDIMLGLLMDELSAEKQRQFGRQCTAVGKLLEEHANLTHEASVQSSDVADMG